MYTHEQYIQAVQGICMSRLSDEDKEQFDGIKLVYGAGQAGLRGVTYYDRWKGSSEQAAPFVEVCAFGQESRVQLAGTTIHELGHVLAGHTAGHSKDWKDACAKLGLRRVMAAGTRYSWAMFAPDIREAIAMLPKPDDGEPHNLLAGYMGKAFKLKPCGQGIGSRGGKSRGAGSGSRLRKYVCDGGDAHKPQIIRASTDSLDCTCNVCGSLFKLA